ncbi:MAG: hypothetical protein NTY12_04155 [Candidatus Falkowbacteria bacterium]|nr:hypothetical protein [Candidatus Falkowbacteria bacterium]
MNKIKIFQKLPPEAVIMASSTIGLFAAILPLGVFMKHTEVKLFLLFTALAIFLFLVLFSIIILTIIREETGALTTKIVIYSLALLEIIGLIAICTFMTTNWKIVTNEIGWLLPTLLFIALILSKPALSKNSFIFKAAGDWILTIIILAFIIVLPLAWFENKIIFFFFLLAAFGFSAMFWQNSLRHYLKWIKKQF